MPAKKSKKRTAKRLPKNLSRWVVSFLIFFVLAASAAWGLNVMFKFHPQFKIKHIKYDMPVELRSKFTKYNAYRGEPVLNVDLKALDSYTPQRYPYLEYIRITRQLPNCLTIEAKPRQPIARVNPELLLDAKGVLFPNALGRDYSELIMVSGLVGSRPALGRPVKSKKLDLAYELLKKIKTSNILNAFGVPKINVSSLNNAYFIIATDTEIRIGDKDTAKRLIILEQIVSDARQELAQIKYIDLRFKDPVIGYK